jgi:hypothetical protein
MPFKTNYRQERAQKTRSKEAKKQEKLARREEASAKRKALREGEVSGESGTGTPEINDAVKPSGE